MFRKLDLASRRLLAHYRALPTGSALRLMRRGVNASGRMMVVLSAYTTKLAA